MAAAASVPGVPGTLPGYLAHMPTPVPSQEPVSVRPSACICLTSGGNVSHPGPAAPCCDPTETAGCEARHRGSPGAGLCSALLRAVSVWRPSEHTPSHQLKWGKPQEPQHRRGCGFHCGALAGTCVRVPNSSAPNSEQLPRHARTACALKFPWPCPAPSWSCGVRDGSSEPRS